MKLGAERKKMAALGILLAVAGGVYWMNSGSDAPAMPVRQSMPGVNAMTPDAAATSQTGPRRRMPSGRPAVTQWEPAPPKTIDPGKVDPTLRLDLLAKVEAINPEGGVRNLFERSQPPPPPGIPQQGNIPVVGKLPINTPAPQPTAATPTGTPAPPPAPPINLKYYGYSTKNSDGEKKAFFLDGDDIIVAAEGEIIKKQYKVVRIGINSVQMEDTKAKSTQTLPLQQEAAPA